jgi:hypothetical protein
MGDRVAAHVQRFKMHTEFSKKLNSQGTDGYILFEGKMYGEKMRPGIAFARILRSVWFLRNL